MKLKTAIPKIVEKLNKSKSEFLERYRPFEKPISRRRRAKLEMKKETELKY